jgi:hypothetical protein
MQQLDSSFTERDYGASSFRQFVEMLKKEGLLEVKRVDSQYIVESPQPEEAPSVADTLFQPQDALPVLYKALKVIDENDLWGQLDYNAVRDYVQRLEPDFELERYGFGQFAELLNYAQDVSLVRLEPDADSVWRVYPGVQFTPTRPVLPAATAKPGPSSVAALPESSSEASEAEEPPAADAEHPGAPPSSPHRRGYRRHSRKRTRPPRQPHHPAAPAS